MQTPTKSERHKRVTELQFVSRLADWLVILAVLYGIAHLRHRADE